jgi:hypothetical protein
LRKRTMTGVDQVSVVAHCDRGGCPITDENIPPNGPLGGAEDIDARHLAEQGKERTTMTEAQLAMKCYAAFHFAVKAVAAGFDLAPSSAEYMKVWSVVKEVAAGNRTLNATPAEMTLRNPDMTPVMKEEYAMSMQEQSRKEQALAQMLLAASNGFVEPTQPE